MGDGCEWFTLREVAEIVRINDVPRFPKTESGWHRFVKEWLEGGIVLSPSPRPREGSKGGGGLEYHFYNFEIYLEGEDLLAEEVTMRRTGRRNGRSLDLMAEIETVCRFDGFSAFEARYRPHSRICQRIVRRGAVVVNNEKYSSSELLAFNGKPLLAAVMSIKFDRPCFLWTPERRQGRAAALVPPAFVCMIRNPEPIGTMLFGVT